MSKRPEEPKSPVDEWRELVLEVMDAGGLRELDLANALSDACDLIDGLVEVISMYRKEAE